MNGTTQSEGGDFPILNLPPLPPVLRYFDDFSSLYRSISLPGELDVWNLEIDGRRSHLNFLQFDESIRGLAKSLCGFNLCRVSPRTSEHLFRGLLSVPPQHVISLVSLPPEKIRSLWKVLQAEGLSKAGFASVKNLLKTTRCG